MAEAPLIRRGGIVAAGLALVVVAIVTLESSDAPIAPSADRSATVETQGEFGSRDNPDPLAMTGNTPVDRETVTRSESTASGEVLDTDADSAADGVLVIGRCVETGTETPIPDVSISVVVAADEDASGWPTPPPTATSGADGRFAIRAPFGEALELRVAEPWAPVERRHQLHPSRPDPGETVVEDADDIDLVTGRHVRGTAVDRQGRPIRSGWLRVGSFEGAIRDGRVDFGTLPLGHHRVETELELGVVASPQAVDVAPHTDTSSVPFVVAVYPSVRGRVVHAETREPIPSWYLEIETDFGTFHGESNPAGRFFVPLEHFGVHRFRVRAEIEDDLWLPPSPTWIPCPTAAPLELVVEPRRRARVRVVRADDESPLVTNLHGASARNKPIQVEAIGDAAPGEYSIRPYDDLVTWLRLQSPQAEFVTEWTRIDFAAARSDDAPIVLRAHAWSPFRITLRRPEDAPPTDLDLTLGSATSPEKQSVWIARWPGVRESVTVHAPSDPTGMRVRVEAPGWLHRTVVVDASQAAARDMEIVLPRRPTAELDIIATDDAGRRLGYARRFTGPLVSLRHVDSGAVRKTGSTRFEKLEAGTWEVLVGPSRRVAASIRLEHDDRRELRLVLPELDGGRVYGIARRDDVPFALEYLYARTVDGSRLRAGTRTDARGRFEFRFLPLGRWLVHGVEQVPGITTNRQIQFAEIVHVDGSTALEVDLTTREDALKVTVRAADGSPAANRWFDVPWYGDVVTDADGSFEIRPIPQRDLILVERAGDRKYPIAKPAAGGGGGAVTITLDR